MSEIRSESSHANADQTELEKLLRSSKPWFEENGTVLIYAVAAVLAVAAVFIYVNRTPAGDAKASHEWLLATSPEDYGDIADTHGDTTIGIWSRLRQADGLLESAVTGMFNNRKVALETRDSAEAAYEQLASRANLPDEVRERVLIGLARVAETHCDGTAETADAAVSAWQQLLNEFEDSLMKDYAEQRVESLQSADSRKFYEWFASLNPQPSLGAQTSVPDVPANDEDSDQTSADTETNMQDDNSSDSDAPTEDANADTTPTESDEPASGDAAEPGQTTSSAEPAEDAAGTKPESETEPAETEPKEAAPAETGESAGEAGEDSGNAEGGNGESEAGAASDAGPGDAGGSE